MIDLLGNCPHCAISFDRGSILETFIKQREEGEKIWQGKTDEEVQKSVEQWYSPPYRWSRVIRVKEAYPSKKEYWMCPDCKKSIPLGTN